MKEYDANEYNMKKLEDLHDIAVDVYEDFPEDIHPEFLDVLEEAIVIIEKILGVETEKDGK